MLIRPALTLVLLAAAAAPARAQQQEDPAAIKERILQKVRERLAEEHKRILERVGKVIDEEFAKEAPAPAPPPDPSPAPVPDDPSKPLAERLRNLDKRIRQLQDAIDDLNRDKRILQREADDAKIIEDARKNPPSDGGEYNAEFKLYYEAHDKKDFKASIAGFKRLYYCFPKTREGAICAYNVACAYSLQGDKEAAIDWLETSIRAGYNQAEDYAHMREDTDLNNIRKERRFLRITVDK